MVSRAQPLGKRIRKRYERAPRTVLPERARLRRNLRQALAAYADDDGTHGVPFEVEDASADLDLFETRRWVRTARRYRIAIPEWPGHEDSNAHWTWERLVDRHCLTERGIAEIASGLRDVKKWRREQVTSLAGTMTGIGALLLSLWIAYKTGVLRLPWSN